MHMKDPIRHDYSGFGHSEPPSPSVFFWLAAYIKSALLVLGGAHPDTARRVCSEREQTDIMILGLLLFGSMCLTAMSLTNFMHAAADDGAFHPGFVVVGILISGMQGLTDNVVQYRAKYADLGQASLHWAGYRLPHLARRRLDRMVLTTVRICQALGISVIAGISFLLLALGSSLTAYNLQAFRAANPLVYQQVEWEVDATIKRAEDDLKASSDRLVQLNRFGTTLRQGNVLRLSRTRGASSSVAASDAQIGKLEASTAAETVTHNELLASLDKLKTDRESLIERRVAASPHATPLATGLNGKFNALSGVLKDSWKMFVLAAAVQVVSAALELAPMWALVLWWPVRWAGYLAERRFIESRRIGDQVVRELGPSPVMIEHVPTPIKHLPLDLEREIAPLPPEEPASFGSSLAAQDVEAWDAAAAAASEPATAAGSVTEPALVADQGDAERPLKPSIAEALGLDLKRPRRSSTHSSSEGEKQ